MQDILMTSTHRMIAAPVLLQQVCGETQQLVKEHNSWRRKRCLLCSLTTIFLSLHEPDLALLFTKKRLLLDVQTLRVGGRVGVHVTDLLSRCCV